MKMRDEGDEKAIRGGWESDTRGQEMRGDAGMTTSGRGRDYVATQLALRRDAVLKEKVKELWDDNKSYKSNR